MRNLKVVLFMLMGLFYTSQSLVAQTDPKAPVDVTVLLSEEAIAAANERIVKCFSMAANNEIRITAINDNVILVRDDQRLLINEQVASNEFINAIDLPLGPYVLIINAGEEKVTREVVKTKTKTVN